MAKVLIVDDDAALRELLKTIITELLGHSAELARDGMEGLTKLRAGRFDLVILDINMPVLSGRELLKLIRRNPEQESLPVLMCTAQNMVGQIDAAFESGASGYIVKPFDIPQVVAQITKILAARPSV